MKWLTEIIATLALIASIASVIYAKQQTAIAEEQANIAKHSYEASIEQFNLAKKAQETAEANYKIAVDQLELQRNIVAADNRFTVVIGTDADENLDGILSNAQNISFSLINGSKNAVVYRVTIRSEGIGLFWQKMTPSKMFYALQMDKRPVLVQPNTSYQRAFSVWVGQNPAPRAKIGIYVNDELAAEYNYVFNPSTLSYTHQRSL
ncbi:MAG: hypothetical protein KGZ83_09000 [Sulfuricella sp.]|nr:hypothetical protein [Sulfuricella sp.]